MRSNPTIRFVIEVLAPFKVLIFSQFFVCFIWALDLSIRPYLLKVIINKVPSLNAENVFNELSSPISFYLLMSLLVIITFRFYDFILLKFNSPFKSYIGNLLMQKMMNHSMTFFQNQFTSSLVSKIKDVMNGVPDLLKLMINQFFGHSLAVVIAFFTIYTISYKFSILLASWIIVFIIGSIFLSQRAKKLCDNASEVRSALMGQIGDVLGNIFSVHLFSSKKFESTQLKTHFDRFVFASQKKDWCFLGIFAFQGFSFVIYQAVGFFFLVSGFKEGTVTSGDFVLLLTINIAIINSLWSLSEDILKFSELTGEIAQGLRIVLAPLDIEDQKNSKNLIIHQGQIVFDQVQFNYKGTPTFFNHQSIVIHSGEKVGLVGYSGGGKTTFVNLILRLYEIQSGHIRIDGQDIQAVTQESLRKSISLIPQDPLLFHRSLMENIRYGNLNSSDEEVKEAAKKAHAHSFIMNLPNQYQALVGERGIKLSGGQRQRIAIARAILKNAPILILDEATSQLDSVTEQGIQESFLALMQNKTTLVIAHRLSTLLHMDRILVFEQGRIVEDGAHSELMKLQGVYAQLWNTQVNGLLPR